MQITVRIPTETYGYVEIIFASKEEYDQEYDAMMEIMEKHKKDLPSNKLAELKKVIGEDNKFAKLKK